MVFIRATKRSTVNHTSYIQYADAHNQKQPHVHVTNKIIKTISYNENITIKTKNGDN